MKTKIALAVSMALLSSAANAQTVLSPTGETLQLDIPSELQATSLRGNAAGAEVKFVPEADLGEGEFTYIVRLRDSSVANYQGTTPGFKATSSQRVQASGTSKVRGEW